MKTSLRWRWSILVGVALTALSLHLSFRSPNRDLPEPDRTEITKDGLPERLPESMPASPPSGRHQLEPRAQAESLPVWAVPYGREFWSPSTASPPQGPPGLNSSMPLPSSPFWQQAISRVRCGLIPQADPDRFQVCTLSYQAEFSPEGLLFTPLHPRAPGIEAESSGTGLEAAAAVQVQLRTHSVRRGQTRLYTDGAAVRSWVVQGDTAQSRLDATAGLVEHVQAQPEGIELSWILAQPPPSSGDLLIEAGCRGLSFLTQTAQGHHFAEASGSDFARLGPFASQAAGSV